MTFDPSSINYVEKSYEDIFMAHLQFMYSLGVLSDDTQFLDYISNAEDIESSYIMMISAVSMIESYIYQDMTKIKNDQGMLSASMEGLKILGKMFLQTRPPEKAITEVDFKCDKPAQENVIIPAGTLAKATVNGSTVVFETLEENSLLANTTSVRIGLQCTVYGTIGNVPAHAIDSLVNSIKGIHSIDNPLPSVGGKDEESKESYLERLLQWNLILPKGTPAAVISAIGDVSAVQGFYIDPYWNGPGTCKIIIDPPMDIVIDRVEDSLTANAKAVDEPYTVVKVEYVPVDVSSIINISLDKTVPVTESMKAAIKIKAEQFYRAYLEGGTNYDNSEQKPLGIGKDYVPFKAANYVSNQISEVEYIETEFPSAPITIESHQKAVAGTFNITVV